MPSFSSIKANRPKNNLLQMNNGPRINIDRISDSNYKSKYLALKKLINT